MKAGMKGTSKSKAFLGVLPGPARMVEEVMFWIVDMVNQLPCV